MTLRREAIGGNNSGSDVMLPACSFTPPRAYPFTLTQFPLAVLTISAILLHVVFSVLHHRSELSPAPTYLSCPPTV